MHEFGSELISPSTDTRNTLHHLIPEVVDDFRRDAPGLGFSESAGGSSSFRTYLSFPRFGIGGQRL